LDGRDEDGDGERNLDVPNLGNQTERLGVDLPGGGPFVNLAPDHTADFEAAILATSDTANTPGTMVGSFAVSDDGAAKYQISIWVPDGRAGVQPNLAFAYSSGGGSDGPLGYGWNLSGLSTISRCGADFKREGTPRAIQFDNGDELCLDGERLALYSGSYNQVGSEYRTEDDKFIKILQVGADQDGPTGFLVYLPDGTRRSYGCCSETQPGFHGDASAILQGLRITVSASNSTTDDPTQASDAQPVRLSWALASSRDRFDNEITYKYTRPPDAPFDYLIDSIQYTSGPTGSADRGVFFYYGDPDFDPVRKDVRTSYVSGLKLQNSKLLRGVLVYGPNPIQKARLRSYVLDYQNDVRRALLTSIKECDSLNVCKPATTFTYSPLDRGFERQPAGNPDATTFVGIGYENNFLIADTSGDGRDDLIYQKAVGGDPGTQNYASEVWYLLQSTGTQFFDAIPAMQVAFGTYGAGETFLDHGLKSVDIDVDGRSDLLLPLPAEVPFGTRRYRLMQSLSASTPAVFSPFETNPDNENDGNPFGFGVLGQSPPVIYAGDMTGSGLPNLIRPHLTGTTPVVWAFREAAAGAAPGPYQDLTYPTSSGGSQNIPTFTQASAITGDWNVYLADTDGDGKQNLLYRPFGPTSPGGLPSPEGMRMYALDGVHPSAPPFVTSLKGSSNQLLHGNVRYLMADVNGDGLADAVEIPVDGGGLRVAINSGRDFLTPFAVPLPATLKIGRSWIGGGNGNEAIDPGIRMVDFDGDGRSDVLLLGDGCATGVATQTLPFILTAVARQANPPAFVNDYWIATEPPALADINSPNPAPYGFCSRSFRKSQILDINGDGQSDFVQVENAQLVLYIHKGKKPDMLTHVTEGSGRTIDVRLQVTGGRSELPCGERVFLSAIL